MSLLRHASFEEIRALIQPSAVEEKLLQRFTVDNPLAGRLFLRVIAFRGRVFEEFNRLAAR